MSNGGGVLVAGAINTDLVARVPRAPEAGETITGTAFAVFGGGKGANQALSAARSGAATTMLGAVGDDDFGRQRLGDLVADGIDVQSVLVTSEAASGVALIVVDQFGENRISYVPGATATIPPEIAVAAFERVRPSIVLTTLELPDDSLEALYRAASAANVPVILNATPEPSSGAFLLPLTSTLIVNETEAMELLNGAETTDWASATGALRNLGPRSIIITLGAEGAIGSSDERIMRVAAPETEVVDTTGAGDAFCGAFAAHLAGGGDIEGAMRAGVAAGSLAVSVAGAQRSMPRLEEVVTVAAKLSVVTE